MMYFAYNTKEEAQSVIDFLPFTDNAEVTYVGTPRHVEPTPKPYTAPIQCNEGWAVIADDFTSQFINGTPIEITFNTPL